MSEEKREVPMDFFTDFRKECSGGVPILTLLSRAVEEAKERGDIYSENSRK